MTETDVRYALTRAADDISAPPDLLDRVRAGGRRRMVRRRTVLAGGLTAAVAAVAVPVALRRGDGPIRAATFGDLAGDERFLARVRETARGDLGGPEPHVWWAGSTPAGPVAVVAQWHPDGRLRARAGTLDELFFITEHGDQLVAAPMRVRVPAGTVEPMALLTGRDRTILVVVTGGRTISLAEDYSFDRAGRVARRFQDLPSGSPAAVVVREVPPQKDTLRIGLRQDDGGPVPLTEPVEPTATQPSVPDRLDRRLPNWEHAWAGVTDRELLRWDVTQRAGYLDPAGYHPGPALSAWRILGALPDGRRFAAQTVPMDGRARLFWLVGRAGQESPAAHYLGVVEPPLSTEMHNQHPWPLVVVHARLPERLGVLVAAENATLRYRVRTDTWLPVKGDAALLPAAATAIQVTPDRGRAVVVRLP